MAGQAGLLTVSDATDGEPEKHMAWHGSYGKSTSHVITWYLHRSYRVITNDGGKQNFPVLLSLHEFFMILSDIFHYMLK